MKLNLTLILLFATALNLLAQDQKWLTNLEEAEGIASNEGKYIIMSFSGSDWCANCKRLHKALFESSDFQSFAEEKLILLNLDFPAKKKNKLPKEQQEYNDALAEKYNTEGKFPLVLILNSKGEIKGKLTYPLENSTAYLEEIQKLIQ